MLKQLTRSGLAIAVFASLSIVVSAFTLIPPVYAAGGQDCWSGKKGVCTVGGTCFGNEDNLGQLDCPQQGMVCCAPKADSGTPDVPAQSPGAAADVAPSSDASSSAGGLSTAKSYGYQPPLGNLSIPQLVARIISKALPVIGALFFLMFVWGGALWLTAGGDDTKVKKARQTLVNAAIGLFIVMGAYAIVYNIIAAFGTAIGQ